MEDYYDALRDWLCPNCGGQGLEYGTGPVLMSNGAMHEAPYNCATCGCWVGWKEKPRTKEQAKTRRPSRGRHRRAAPLQAEKCFWCHRTGTELAALGLQLEWAHRDGRADLIDAGIPDDLDDLVPLCTEDHREQHHRIAQEERNRQLIHHVREQIA
jgi:hypothetical protein